MLTAAYLPKSFHNLQRGLLCHWALDAMTSRLHQQWSVVRIALDASACGSFVCPALGVVLTLVVFSVVNLGSFACDGLLFTVTITVTVTAV